MAKKQTQKKNGGKKKQQAQGAVAAGAVNAFEPEPVEQGVPVTAPVSLQASSDYEAESAPAQETAAVKAQPISFSFVFDVPKKAATPNWQSIMVRVLPEDGRTLQSLADVAGMPLSTLCRSILHSAAQQAREQGAE